MYTELNPKLNFVWERKEEGIFFKIGANVGGGGGSDPDFERRDLYLRPTVGPSGIYLRTYTRIVSSAYICSYLVHSLKILCNFHINCTMQHLKIKPFHLTIEGVSIRMEVLLWFFTGNTFLVFENSDGGFQQLTPVTPENRKQGYQSAVGTTSTFLM